MGTNIATAFLSILSMYLIATPIFLFLLYETMILAFANARKKHLNNSFQTAGKGSLEVIVPIYSEPIELVVEKTRWNSTVFLLSPCFTRLTLLSDDVGDYVKILTEFLGYELPVHVFHRSSRRGGRTGALDDYLGDIKASHFLILDVDAEATSEIVSKLCRMLPRRGAVVMPWEGYYTRETRLARAVKFFTDFGSEILYRARSKAGFFIFPLGSGTVYDKSVVLEVGGWGDNIVQDDIWMGVKLAMHGYYTTLFDDLSVRVLVPSTYAALRVQQKRWAYGTSDVLRRSALKLVRSQKLSLWKRLEMIAYMSLPLLTIPVSIAFLLLPIASILEPHVGLNIFFSETFHILAPFLLLLPVYLYLYRSLIRKYCLKETLVNLGRFAAILATLSPNLAWYSLKGLSLIHI